MAEQLRLDLGRFAVSLRAKKIRKLTRQRLALYWPELQRLSMRVGELAETSARLDLMRAESRRAVTRQMGRSNVRNLAKFAASGEGRAVYRRIERLGKKLEQLEGDLCA